MAVIQLFQEVLLEIVRLLWVAILISAAVLADLVEVSLCLAAWGLVAVAQLLSRAAVVPQVALHQSRQLGACALGTLQLTLGQPR